MADEQTPAEEIPAWTPPENWPEQFKSPEALLDAYNGLRPKVDRLETELQQERQAFASALESLPQQQPQTYQQQGFDPALSAFTSAYESGDPAAMLAATQQGVLPPLIDAVGKLLDERFSAITPAVEAAQAAQREHDIRLAEGLVERNLGPEKYAQLLPRIRELVADNPNFLPTATSVEGYASSIMNVAKLAEHDTLQRQIAEYEKERAEKLNAQTLSGGYNRPAGNPDADRAEFERIKNTPTGSFQELLAKAGAQRGA